MTDADEIARKLALIRARRAAESAAVRRIAALAVKVEKDSPHYDSNWIDAQYRLRMAIKELSPVLREQLEQEAKEQK